MVTLIDLPKEILLQIAFLLTPPGPCPSAAGPTNPPCAEIDDLKNLRSVHKAWHEMIDTVMSTCVYRHGPLALSSDRFKTQLSRTPQPANVRHAHLSTEELCVQNSGLYVSSLPFLKTVEVFNLEALLWKDLAKALKLARNLRVLTVHCDFGWDTVNMVIDSPPKPEDRLQHVTTLTATNIETVDYVERLLEWHPNLERLKLQMHPSCRGEKAAGFDRALVLCAPSLKHLDIRDCAIFTPLSDQPTIVDLRDMEVLEEVILGSLTTIASRPNNWAFSASVKRIYDTAFNNLPVWQRCAYECLDALHQLWSNNEKITPGLQELKVRVSPGLTKTQKDMLNLVGSSFSNSKIKLILERQDEE